jgi:LacI family transcriptional regulator
MALIRLGLVFNYDLHYCRCVLRGVKQYAETKPDWVFLSAAAEKKPVRSVHSLPLDGLIAQVHTPALAADLAALKRPLVNVSRALEELPFPRIGVDEAAVGRLAASHFLDRGLRHFAFLGNPGYYYSNEREAGFRRALVGAGHSVARFHLRPAGSLAARNYPWALDGKLRRWLLALPRPVGLFASNDVCGSQLSETCHEVGLRVPEQVALVSVDNDDLLCELTRPSLSSVALPAERIGYEAAALLDRLLGGDRPPRRPLLLAPLGVVARQSSDVVALDDPEVAAALRFIRDHRHAPLSVSDVLRAVPVSRRALERRFRQALQRGVGDEIRRVHLERAKELLAGTELPVASVAERSGFSGGKHLCVVFRQETGQTPTAYRRQFQI